MARASKRQEKNYERMLKSISTPGDPRRKVSSVQQFLLVGFYNIHLGAGPKYDRDEVSYEDFSFESAPYEELDSGVNIRPPTENEKNRILAFLWRFVPDIEGRLRAYEEETGASWSESRHFLRFADDYHNTRRIIDEYMKKAMARQALRWLYSRLGTYRLSLELNPHKAIRSNDRIPMGDVAYWSDNMEGCVRIGEELLFSVVGIELPERLGKEIMLHILRPEFEKNGVSLPPDAVSLPEGDKVSSIRDEGGQFRIDDRDSQVQYIVRRVGERLDILIERYSIGTLWKRQISEGSHESNYYGFTELMHFYDRVLRSLCDMLEESWPIAKCAFRDQEGRPICGNIFVKTPGEHSFCSDECRTKHFKTIKDPEYQKKYMSQKLDPKSPKFDPKYVWWKEVEDPKKDGSGC